MTDVPQFSLPDGFIEQIERGGALAIGFALLLVVPFVLKDISRPIANASAAVGLVIVGLWGVIQLTRLGSVEPGLVGEIDIPPGAEVGRVFATDRGARIFVDMAPNRRGIAFRADGLRPGGCLAFALQWRPAAAGTTVDRAARPDAPQVVIWDWSPYDLRERTRLDIRLPNAGAEPVLGTEARIRSSIKAGLARDECVFLGEPVGLVTPESAAAVAQAVTSAVQASRVPPAEAPSAVQAQPDVVRTRALLESDDALVRRGVRRDLAAQGAQARPLMLALAATQNPSYRVMIGVAEAVAGISDRSVRCGLAADLRPNFDEFRQRTRDPSLASAIQRAQQDC